MANQSSSKITTIDSNTLPIVVPEERQFEETGEGQDFLHAPELERICRELMDTHPHVFGHLQQMKLTVLWKKTGGKTKGKLTLGKTQAANGLTKFLGATDFIICLSADHLHRGTGLLQRAYAEALLGHEMLHIGWDPDEGKIVMRDHDFVGFHAELTLFGAWDEDLTEAAASFTQLGLFAEERRAS
jgi:hypothetical protein